VRVLFASSNPHKVAEVRAILAGCGVEVDGLDAQAGALPEPVEDAPDFAGNARIKAVYYAQRTARPCLADDSGLEVDALGGAPGVRSARYAGAEGARDERDRANNAKLLRELAGVPRARRTARFVCAMCLAGPGGDVLAETQGAVEGRIGFEPRGTNGFGYDPLFELPDRGCTSAELPPADKNAISHRGRAARAMALRMGGARLT
jgi:XTP/dITP diphosphohydrolase